MKTRNGYVSNSSSSSFLLPHPVNGHAVSCIKLPREIWKAIEKNHIEWDGKKFDMSASDEWWLTDMVSDCDDTYSEICDIENSIAYLEGDTQPYGSYDEDGEKNYIIFKKGDDKFYILASDFMDERGISEIPESVDLRDGAKKILESKSLNKTQKLNALRFLFDF